MNCIPMINFFNRWLLSYLYGNFKNVKNKYFLNNSKLFIY